MLELPFELAFELGLVDQLHDAGLHPWRLQSAPRRLWANLLQAKVEDAASTIKRQARANLMSVDCMHPSPGMRFLSNFFFPFSDLGAEHQWNSEEHRL
jgi:hypothetical protein